MVRVKPVKDEIPYQHFWELSPEKRVHVARLQVNYQQDVPLSHPHHLAYYSLRFVHRGEGTIYIDHMPAEITNNWVMLATPDQVSRVDIPDDTEIDLTVIAFNDFFIDAMGLPPDVQSLVLGEWSHIHRTLNESEMKRFVQYLELIQSEFLEASENMELIVAGLTKALLLHLIKVNPPAPGRRMYMNLYRQFLDLLKQHFTSHHLVTDYSELMGITEKRLNRSCKAITGQTASEVIQRHIGHEARRLLYYSSNTIKEISYHLGFHDPAHFNKFFRNQYGMTPGEYRKSV